MRIHFWNSEILERAGLQLAKVGTGPKRKHYVFHYNFIWMGNFFFSWFCLKRVAAPDGGYSLLLYCKTQYKMIIILALNTVWVVAS